MSVLVVAAHADDEILGCGGVIAKHADQGDDVHILIVAEGITSRDETRNAGARKDEISVLHEAAHNAAFALGVPSQIFCGLPDNRLDSMPLLDIIKIIEQHLVEFAPSVVYTHHGGDLNVDHRIVHQAVLTASRPIAGSSVRKIYSFETPSSTEWSKESLGPPFVPNVFVNIEETLPRKMEALRCYDLEMRPFPHSRSYKAVEALACWRGAASGMVAAEAFMLIRELAK